MNHANVVVVDDERTFEVEPGDVVVYYRTAQEAIGGLGVLWTQQHVSYAVALDELWLDHDLGDGGSAMMVAEFLDALASGGMPLQVRSIYVHSMNPHAADIMTALLRRHHPTTRVTRVPLPTLA